jgi:hypothetical protein
MKLRLPAVVLFASLAALQSAKAVTIDFEAQGASAPSSFNNTLNSPLTIGLATFTGGQLLKNEFYTSSIADPTAVYATQGYTGSYSNPLLVTFSQPVSNVSVLVTNGIADTYTLTNNLGASVSAPVGTNTSALFSFSGTGITQLSIGAGSNPGWDFAIDNLSYTAVPEIDANSCAGGLALLGGLLSIWRGRKSKVSAAV